MLGIVNDIANRALCLFVGHSPERTGTRGDIYPRFEMVQTHTGPGRVPLRTVAEIERCRRCTARHVVVDLAPLTRADRRTEKWVTT